MLAANASLASPLTDALLRSPNFKVRLKAATELGKAPDPEGILALIRATQDAHPLVRMASASSLSRLKATSATPTLCALRADLDDLVRRTAERAVETLGGESACSGQKVYVEFDVVGDDPRLSDFVRQELLRKAREDERVVLDDAAARERVTAGELPGAALQLNLTTTIDRSSGGTRLTCRVGQAVFELRKERILRGSASQQAEIDLGTAVVTEAGLSGQMQGCVAALVPVIYEGFGDYLKGVK